MTVPREAAVSNGRTSTSARKHSACVGGYCARLAVHFRHCGFALVACLALAAAAMPSRVHAQGAVKSVHGDWQIRCETPPGAQSEQCALFQSVVAEDRATVGITGLVLKTAAQKSRQ